MRHRNPFDRIAVINHGKLLACETPAGLKRLLARQPRFNLTLAPGTDGWQQLGSLPGVLQCRPKMQPTAYADSMRALAKTLTMRLDSLTTALTTCEKTGGRDPTTVATTLTSKLKNYDDALLAFRTALKPDSTKAISQQ